MIQGYVTDDLEAWLPLKLWDIGGTSHLVEVIIDTGFNGSLTLPTALIQQLNLPWSSRSPGDLADGSQIWFDVDRGWVEWNARMIEVPIDATEGDPLFGMSLMRGFRLTVDVIEDGRYRLESLAR